MESYNDKIKKFAKILAESNHTVFFGGAGVSTESGLKDYRSETGIYNTVTSYGYPPETILSHSFFMENTSVFYKFYKEFFIGNVSPNKAHLSLSHLEEKGMLKCVITQNVDNLHQEAGSKNVLELHGTAEKYYCLGCGKEYTKEIFSPSFKTIDGVPKCSCGGIIRPHVTLYEEALDEETTDMAIRHIYSADTLIIGGTSLAVYPAAAYLRYFGGKNLIVINKQQTPADKNASLVFYESIGKVLTDTVSAINN
jgi:NAD-dependent deacetylase